MNKNLFTLLTTFLLLSIASLGYAQEICNNGIDDDNDGLIDCFDPDCSGNSDCSGYFYGATAPACTFTPTAGTFELEEVWNTRTANGGTDGNNNLPGNIPIDQRASVMIGDMDGDGFPEVVAKHDAVDVPGSRPNGETFVPELYIIDGRTGVEKARITVDPNNKFSSLAIGDVDNNGKGDIFFFNNSGQLLRYEYDGGTSISLIFRSTSTDGNGLNTPSLADFDHDGVVEVYAGNRIYSAIDGTLLANGTNGSGSGSTGEHSSSPDEPFSVAVDIDMTTSTFTTTNLELVAGNVVYDVDFTQPFNNRLSVRNTATSATGVADGVTAIADLDNDGDVDAVVVADGYVYAWDLNSNAVIANPFQISTATTSNTTATGGRANIANFDVDTPVEIGIAGRSIYIVFDLNIATQTLSEKWSTVTDDNSQRTSSTVFDFEGDGINEIVYSDEENLIIYDGRDGTELSKIISRSGTRFDNPLVVDVNGDGQSEIIITAQDGNGPSDDENGYIRCFRSKDKPWVPSRKVWNQHSYMIVNVNDDLTIPRVQQNTTILGAQSEPKKVINNFLNQASIYDINGNHVFASPDMQIAFVGSNTFCQSGADNTITLNFTISNPGDATLPANVPVAVFSDNPYTTASPTLIESFETSDPVTAKGTPLQFSRTITAPASTDPIYIVVNHNHAAALSGAKYPLNINNGGNPVSGIAECDFDNNFFTLNATSGTVNQGLTVRTSGSVICTGSMASVFVENSETGVNYQLRKADGTLVGTSVAGTGGTIELSTGLVTEATTYTVIGSLADGSSCSLPLTNTANFTIETAPDRTLVVESSTTGLCVGANGTVTIRNAQNGIDYQATINGASVGTQMTGTGADLTLTIPSSSLTVGANTIVINANNNGCIVSLNNTVTINVANPPAADRTIEPANICVDSGSPAVITIHNSEMGVSYQLRNDADNSNIGTAVAGNGGAITLTSEAVTSPIVFNILGTGTAGCNQSTTMNQKINAFVNTLTVDAIIETGLDSITVLFGESVNITVTGADSYTWTTRREDNQQEDPTTIVSQSATADAITVMPQINTWYIATGQDANGCTRTDSVLVVLRSEIYIPSLFSPNDDGNNDGFRIVARGVVELDLKVFDRAGNLLYETQNIEEATTTGWDGTHNGERQPISMYIWSIEGKFFNGAPVQYEGRNQGKINLVR